MEFRKAERKDIPELVNIRKAYLLHEFESLTEENFPELESRLAAYFEKHIDGDFTAYIALDKSEIVSSAFLLVAEKPCSPAFPTGRTGTVLNVYTKPEYRRQGAASTLIEELLADSKLKGLDFVELKATADGRPMYQKLGFKDEKSRNVPMKFIL